MVQVHYANPTHAPGHLDASGFDVCTTAQLRPNDAGIMAFGTMSFTSSLANGSAIGNSNPTQIIMQSGGTQKDSISALSGGTDFSATWLHQ